MPQISLKKMFATPFFCTIGNFISYRVKKDAPLWMRTTALRQSEITRKMVADATARRECAPGRTFFCFL